MFADQPDPSDWTGRPVHWTINTSNGQFRVDRTPTSSENGDVYSFLYDKRITIDEITDTFPFSDTAFDAIVPVAAELWSVDQHRDSRRSVYAGRSFIRALKLIKQTKERSHYGVRRIGNC